MEILNPDLKSALDNNELIKLELGAGGSSKKGYSVDVVALDGVDVIADLNEPLSLLPDNCADYVYSRHTLEHIENLDGLLREIHRITVPDGKIEIVVPHYSNPYFYSDPTHKRYFGLYTLYYYVDQKHQPDLRKVPCFYTDIRFQIEKIKIEFYRRGRLEKPIARRLERWVNKDIKRQDFFERRIANLFHAWQIRYIFHPAK